MGDGVAAAVTLADIFCATKFVDRTHADLADHHGHDDIAGELDATVLDRFGRDHESGHRAAVVLHGLAEDSPLIVVDPSSRALRQLFADPHRHPLFGIHVAVENQFAAGACAAEHADRVRSTV